MVVVVVVTSNMYVLGNRRCCARKKLLKLSYMDYGASPALAMQCNAMHDRAPAPGASLRQ